MNKEQRIAMTTLKKEAEDCVLPDIKYYEHHKQQNPKNPSYIYIKIDTPELDLYKLRNLYCLRIHIFCAKVYTYKMQN